MSTIPRSVVFDFGGVLLRWKPQEIINTFYADEISREALRQSVFQHPDWKDMDAGVLGEADAVRRFAARLGRPPEEMKALMEHIKDSLTPIEESFAIVNELASRGIPVFGLSNMPAFTFDHLRRRYGHWDVFRGIVISGTVKLVKPDRAIFEHISRLYGLEPSETVFIDDHLPNIEAARQLGFHGILFRDPHQCAHDLALLGPAARPATDRDSDGSN
jgi:putative hydrolase of the HAD superfamily